MRPVDQSRSPIERVLRPFQEFVRIEASGGIVLLACTVLALAWSNSPASSAYFHLWETKLTFGLGGLVLSKSLLHWINDGLMVIFFFVVGLEIKRELLVGELARPQQAALPVVGAVGGMVVPALLYGSLNAGTPGSPGWGIPMATDIAFALGMLSILGKRVPLGLKIFLTALAIVDDIGAVIVIALYYTAEISWICLVVAGVVMILLVIANLVGVRHYLFYALLGIILWAAFLKSGIHTTVAGVLLAMTIPSARRINTSEFADRVRRMMDRFERGGTTSSSAALNEDQKAAVQSLESAFEEVQSPMQNLEHALHPLVTFVVMPVFALANAGVALTGGGAAATTAPVDVGILLGLVLGKPVGITLFAWIAVRAGIAALPSTATWRQVWGVGLLGGIGFTMSLFIAGLAFADGPLLMLAKKGILMASLMAGIAGWILLRWTRPAAET